MRVFGQNQRKNDKTKKRLKELAIAGSIVLVVLCGFVASELYVMYVQPKVYYKEELQILATAEVGDVVPLGTMNTDYIKKVEKTSTGVAVIVVTESENRIIIDSGANALITKDDIDKFLENASEGDVFLTQLESPIDVVGYALELAKKKGLLAMLNPAPANVEIKKYLPCVDIITPNETELEILGGVDALLECGISTVITTLGARGYEIATKEGAKIYPCIKVKAVDTTAAGDTASGGLAVKLASGETVEEAMKFGSLCASIACTKRGAQMSVPSLNELSEYTCGDSMQA